MSPAIPDRWLNYKPYGEPIKGTKILAFKVPLKNDVVNKLNANERFSISTLLEAFPKLKLIIDLTNTTRYYDRKEFTDAGVTYEKLMVEGHKVPSMNCVKQFFKIMDDFMASSGEDDIVGIHCTHGINRTGYLVCRYLIQQMNWDVDDSLKAFGEARGYSIERDNYVNSLMNVPKGQKIDTTDVVIPKFKPQTSSRKMTQRSQGGYTVTPMGPPPPRGPMPMGPPKYVPPHRRFTQESYRFRGPQPIMPAGPAPFLGPMPPPNRPLGPMPFDNRNYIPHRMTPMRPPMPPPFPLADYPPRMNGSSCPFPPRREPRMPSGPASMPPPKMAPPMRSIFSGPFKKPLMIRNHHRGSGSAYRIPKRTDPDYRRRQDFTLDTYEENLALTTARARRDRYARAK